MKSDAVEDVMPICTCQHHTGRCPLHYQKLCAVEDVALANGLSKLREANHPAFHADLDSDEATALLNERENFRHDARVLAVLALQSDRYSTDEGFRLAVDSVMAQTRGVVL